MVDRTIQFVARKYAVAYLNVFGSDFVPDDLGNLDALSDFLKEYHHVTYLLGLPVIPHQKKKEMLNALSREFHLTDRIDKLVDLLLHDKRLFLLGPILEFMARLYREKHHIIEFSITSYPCLSESDLNDLTQFLARSTGCAIIYTNNEDKNLIAGIRMESTTYLWEFSIAQQLRTLRIQTMR